MALSTAPPQTDFCALRDAEFEYVARSPYLNAASVGPLPERARRAIDAYNLRRSNPHALRGDDFEPTLVRCRQAAAALIGAGEDEIALLPNTSFGVNLAALCLPLEAGRRVIVSDREFPANMYPWLALRRLRGVRVDVIPAEARGNPDEARILEELARGDVGLVALSAVQFTNGWLADGETIGRACRAQGAWFVVDGIQALGQLPLDVAAWNAHVLATGGQKWLCSPFGTGFTYVRRELVGRMEPRVVGWTAMAASADLERVLEYRQEWVPGARRFEVGAQPWQDYAGMAESLELLGEAGPAQIRAHVLALLDPLAAFLEERGVEVVSDMRPERRSGIISFRPADAAGAFDALTQAGVGCVLREGAVRLSAHLYNQPEDVATVMNVLDGWMPR
ncbi:MAG TPA: aminotransferase class V-fold PLP-dependent enzyme [Longimicrobium sp.]|jgi:selenocysteine lyase/cysteine desulfurase|uniref:aminotransferase class V-fold PLP-dependent enzyme n=1 Tax=Longimicrobium sp. TaxID=2029185 RepID=UPI002ED7F10E